MKNKKILIADDHPLFRAGVKQVIENKTGYSVILEADSGDKAFEIIKKEHPDIALLDIQMPGLTGLQIATAVEPMNLSTKIILLTMFDDKAIFLKALDAGVRGYLLKDSSENEIVSAVNKVAEDGYYLSPQLSASLLRPAKIKGEKNVFEALSDAELKVVTLLAELKSNDEIATELFISKRTVENHKVNIARKLELPGSKNLLKFAVENKDRLLLRQ